MDEIQDENIQSPQSQEEFSIPEEYQGKRWVEFFGDKKGEELKAELIKSYDNSQSLIGKKVEDYLATTDLKSLDNYEQIKEQLAKQIAPEMNVPEDVKEYNLKDVLSESDFQLPIEQASLDSMAGKFKELGINTKQGQEILKEYVKLTTEDFERVTNPEELEKGINQIFDGDKQKRNAAESLIKEFLPETDKKIINEIVPNVVIEMFYKVAKGVVDKFGYKEGTGHSGNYSSVSMSDAERETEYERIVSEMENLSKRPHTDSEKAKYQKELNRLFER